MLEDIKKKIKDDLNCELSIDELIELNKLESEYNKLLEENSLLREEQRKNELSIERKTRNSNKEQKRK